MSTAHETCCCGAVFDLTDGHKDTSWLGYRLREFRDSHAVCREQGPVEEHVGDGACQDCTGSTLVWYADNDWWNQVMGGEGGLLCPCCFLKRADDGRIVARLSRDRDSSQPPPTSASVTETGQSDYYRQDEVIT